MRHNVYLVSNPKYYKSYTLGCYPLGYENGNCFIYDCGLGLGILTTKISESNKHGIGGNVGISHIAGKLHSLREISPTGPFEFTKRSGIAFQISVNYTYFFNGLGKSEWNIGIVPTIEYFKGDIFIATLPSLGYQY